MGVTTRSFLDQKSVSKGSALKVQLAKEQVVEEKHEKSAMESLNGDVGNIIFLLALYVLQGIPKGIYAVMVTELLERGVSFSELGYFSLARNLPFSIKLLWAPIVDTLYINCFGRRKSWLVPLFLLSGVVFLGLSWSLEWQLYGEKPLVNELTVYFFVLLLLSATQDVAVDGWSLTLLREENRSYSAMCDSAGCALGFAIGFSGYTVLEKFNIVNLSSFHFAWGVIFIVMGVAVALFKTERPPSPEDLEDEPEDIKTAYQQMMSIFQLRAMRPFIPLLLSWSIAFPIVEQVAPLKLQEAGIPKEHLAYISSILVPLTIMCPVFVAPSTNGPKPLSVALSVHSLRLALIPTMLLATYLVPTSTVPPPWFFYGIILVIFAVREIAFIVADVAIQGFFSRISDPSIGGTYMTMLNTVNNVGKMVATSATFYLVDWLSCKEESNMVTENNATSFEESCTYKRDGFTTAAILVTIFGTLWLYFAGPLMRKVELIKEDDWKVRGDTEPVTDDGSSTAADESSTE